MQNSRSETWDFTSLLADGRDLNLPLRDDDVQGAVIVDQQKIWPTLTTTSPTLQLAAGDEVSGHAVLPDAPGVPQAKEQGPDTMGTSMAFWKDFLESIEPSASKSNPYWGQPHEQQMDEQPASQYSAAPIKNTGRDCGAPSPWNSLLQPIPTANANSAAAPATTSPTTGLGSQVCPDCGGTIMSAHEYHLRKHIGSGPCVARQKKAQKEKEKENITHLLAELSSSAAPTPSSSSHPSRLSSRSSSRCNFALPTTPGPSGSTMPARLGHSISINQPTSLSSSPCKENQFLHTLPVLDDQDPNHKASVCSDIPDRVLTAQVQSPLCRQPTTPQRCLGVLQKWRPGPVHSTFPFQMLGSELGFKFDRFSDVSEDEMWVRSTSCTLVADEEGNACHACLAVYTSKAWISIEERASGPALPHTSYHYLTHEQSCAKLNEKSEIIRELRQQARNSKQATNNTNRKLDDYKRLLSALATNDVKRLRHLIASALKRRMSIKAILAQIELAIADIYHVRKFDQDDIDLATIVRHLGGRKCLFALSRALGLPSINTVNKVAYRSIISLSPGAPTLAEIQRNLQVSFPPNTPAGTRRAGHACMIDGIAIRQSLRWIRSLNAIGGLCREHVGGLDLSMSDFDTVMNVWNELHGDVPTCHYAREATVAVFGAFREEGYVPLPALVSPTCKAEKAPAFANILRMLVTGWHESAEENYGPLWCIATNGDSSFRLGGHRECNKGELDPTDELFGYLSGLRGLNLACGERNITYTSDPKHCIKRLATLLRSKDGVMINHQSVNRSHLEYFLTLLPHESEESVRILIDPADHQNVPRAVKLMIAIEQLTKLDSSSMRPMDLAIFTALQALNDVISAILQPFINPDFSLSDQLTSLTTAAFLLFAHYRLHGTSFMSNQLYADLQSITKTALFCVAKQQILDNTQPFYLYQQGQDRLEEVFAVLRSLTHDRNVDALQLCEDLSGCVDSIHAFARHPEWQQTQRRLSYNSSDGIDHVNPKFFKGDLVVGHVDLGVVWRAGRSQAESLLTARIISFDFTAALSSPGVDFLRPYGGGKYVGVSEEHDTSMPASEEGDDDGVAEQGLDNGNIGGKESMSVKDEIDDDDDFHLQDHIADFPDANGTVRTSEDIPADWISIPNGNGEGKPVHKASILAYFFKSGKEKLSADRLLRVRIFTVDFKKEDLEDPVIGDTIFRVRDLAICAVRTKDKIVPVLITITSIEKHGKRVASTSLGDLKEPESDIEVTGQVLALVECELGGARGASWVWNGDYVQFSGTKSSSTTSEGSRASNGLRKSHIVTVPGHLVVPVNEGTLPTSLLPDVATKRNLIKHSKGTTYFITRESFNDIVEAEFESLDIPAYQKLQDSGPSLTVPYVGLDGRECLINCATRALADKKILAQKIACYQCGCFIKPDLLRAHVGEHILRALMGLPELGLLEPIADVLLACGFCGRSNCGPTAIKSCTGKKKQIISRCSRKHSFAPTHAAKPSQNQPSTNIPLICSLCGPDPFTGERPSFWKYSLFVHIKHSHPHYWDTHANCPANLPPSLINELQVSAKEVSLINAKAKPPQPFGPVYPLVRLPFVSVSTQPAAGIRRKLLVDRALVETQPSAKRQRRV